MPSDAFENDDLQIILEPVNPGSIYTHIEIDQTPIRAGGSESPGTKLAAILRGGLSFASNCAAPGNSDNLSLAAALTD